MEKSEEELRKEESHATFTPELQERRRSRANKPFYPREPYFNTQATRDTIRHFVNGYGDVDVFSPVFVPFHFGLFLGE